MSQPPKQAPHPIVELIFSHLEEQKKGAKEKLKLKPSVKAPLRVALKEIRDPAMFETAIVELVGCAQFLAFMGSPSVLLTLATYLTELNVLPPAAELSTKRVRDALNMLGVQPSVNLKTSQSDDDHQTKWWNVIHKNKDQ